MVPESKAISLLNSIFSGFTQQWGLGPGAALRYPQHLRSCCCTYHILDINVAKVRRTFSVQNPCSLLLSRLLIQFKAHLFPLDTWPWKA